MKVKKLAEITRNSGKNERLDEPKTRTGGSCKNEIEMKDNWLYLANYHPLGTPGTDNWSFSSEASNTCEFKTSGNCSDYCVQCTTNQ